MTIQRISANTVLCSCAVWSGSGVFTRVRIKRWLVRA